jgi:phosphoserine phosphatase
MLATTLSSAEWHSGRYLTNLCHKAVCFSLPELHQFQLHAATGEGSHDLVMFAESLNLEKLHDIQTALADVIDILYFLPGADLAIGNVVEARVTVTDLQGSSEIIERVSLATQVEISLLAQRPSLAQPGILLMDMDSTVIGIECIDEIAKLAGVGEQVSEVTELAMQGKLDFVESLNSRVACLQGAPVSILKTVRDQLPINPGISQLLATLRAANWKLAIASGGFTYFADYLLERLELDYAISNQLEIDQQHLTGKVTGEVINAQGKADTLVRLARHYDIDMTQTIALGDGANDLLMMDCAGLGVAYHAKPVVRQRAHAALRFSAADGLLAFLRH